MIIGLVDYRIWYLASFQLSESVFRSVYCPNATWWFIINTPTDILQITFIHTAHRHLYVAGDTYLYRRLSCPWWQLRGAACSSSCLERWGRPPDTAARTPPENDTEHSLYQTSILPSLVKKMPRNSFTSGVFSTMWNSGSHTFTALLPPTTLLVQVLKSHLKIKASEHFHWFRVIASSLDSVYSSKC